MCVCIIKCEPCNINQRHSQSSRVVYYICKIKRTTTLSFRLNNHTILLRCCAGLFLRIVLYAAQQQRICNKRFCSKLATLHRQTDTIPHIYKQTTSSYVILDRRKYIRTKPLLLRVNYYNRCLHKCLTKSVVYYFAHIHRVFI